MKRNLILFALLIANICSFAQLSTRENDATTEKIGTRPQAGNMSLNFSFGLVNDSAAGLYNGNALTTGDILTFKYYLGDDVAIRAGLRLYKGSISSKGEASDSSMLNMLTPPYLTENRYKDGKREYILVPGIEKHFSNSNIFDVYAGADLYIGLGKEITINNEEYSNKDYNRKTCTTGTSTVGLGGVVGFNVFVAHLPISLGLEYGWNAKWVFGGKTKVVEEVKAGSNTDSKTYFTQDNDPFGNPDPTKYENLKRGRSNWDTNGNVRITANIYFGK